MGKNITDRLLLKTIYDKYYSDFCVSEHERESKHYVPIDCAAIAKKLKTDNDIVFGRLYYHLDKKHRYQQNNKTMVHLFTTVIGQDKDAINFPLLSAVLAELEELHHRFSLPLFVSFISLLISIMLIITTTQNWVNGFPNKIDVNVINDSIGVSVENILPIGVNVENILPIDVNVSNDVGIENIFPIGVNVENILPIGVSVENIFPIDVNVSN